MKISLIPFDLNKEVEWNSYLKEFMTYISETCSKDDNYSELISYLNSEGYKMDTLAVINRDSNPFNVMRIYAEEIIVGFIDYICYVDEDGKCIIGNFYIYPDFGNQGIGTECYRLAEVQLRIAGGKFVEITPEEKAINLYVRMGYYKTEKVSSDNGLPIYRKEL